MHIRINRVYRPVMVGLPIGLMAFTNFWQDASNRRLVQLRQASTNHLPFSCDLHLWRNFASSYLHFPCIKFLTTVKKVECKLANLVLIITELADLHLISSRFFIKFSGTCSRPPFDELVAHRSHADPPASYTSIQLRPHADVAVLLKILFAPTSSKISGIESRVFRRTRDRAAQETRGSLRVWSTVETTNPSSRGWLMKYSGCVSRGR